MTDYSPPPCTVSSLGVRLVWRCEVLASAPGGSDSIRRVSVAGDDLKKSMLGKEAEHAARVKPHATKAMTRLMVRSHQLGGQSRAAYPQSAAMRSVTGTRETPPAASPRRMAHAQMAP